VNNLYQRSKKLIRRYNFYPKRILGQHFMIDAYSLRLIMAHAGVNQSDTTLEVGAGFGFLTRLLARKAKKVLAVEEDAKLCRALRNELSDLHNVVLIQGNILKVPLPPFNKVVSNPPFSISTPLILLLLRKRLDSVVLTLQEEFIRKLTALAGSRDYGKVTVLTFYRCEVEMLEPVSREAFYPKPAVQAAIVRLNYRKHPPFHVVNNQVFQEVVQTLFTQRNRKVRKAILPYLSRHHTPEAVEGRARVDNLPLCKKRVRDMTPKDFGVLANGLSP
jgi:16S rRNA (adenine1518-N6/adenine1519-N6)-dimethyltransferase